MTSEQFMYLKIGALILVIVLAIGGYQWNQNKRLLKEKTEIEANLKKVGDKLVENSKQLAVAEAIIESKGLSIKTTQEVIDKANEKMDTKRQELDAVLDNYDSGALNSNMSDDELRRRLCALYPDKCRFPSS